MSTEVKMMNPSLSNLYQLFEDYAECVTNGDARGISRFFALPCLMMSDDRTTAFSDAPAIEVLFLQGFSFLRKHGIQSVRPDVRNRKPLTSHMLQCNVVWSYYNEAGTLLYSCDYL